MQKRLLTVIVAMLAVALVAAASSDPFAGTWKLNVAKSKFSGPAPKSETVMIDPGGKVSFQEATGTGETVAWSYSMPPGGGEATIAGMENSTVIEKRPDPRTVEHTWKMGDASYTGRGTLSKSGKVLTYTMDGTNAKGEKVHNVEIYDKQ